MSVRTSKERCAFRRRSTPLFLLPFLLFPREHAALNPNMHGRSIVDTTGLFHLEYGPTGDLTVRKSKFSSDSQSVTWEQFGVFDTSAGNIVKNAKYYPQQSSGEKHSTPAQHLPGGETNIPGEHTPDLKPGEKMYSVVPELVSALRDVVAHEGFAQASIG